MRKSVKNIICMAFALLFTAGHQTLAQDSRAAPERESATNSKQLVRATRQMVVTANPHASAAGHAILKNGGSAIDAAVAAQMVLTLVEPQSSGIGGGAFLLHWNKENKKLETFDGRETAPATAQAERFLNPDGSRMKFHKASFGGHAVGVPGLVKMLKKAHDEHGRLPWSDLFEPAITLAETGFMVSPRLHTLLKAAKPTSFGPTARAYFYDSRQEPHPIGYVLRNPDLATTFRQLARRPDSFYIGNIADAIIARVQTNTGPKNLLNKGDLTEGDFAGYRAKIRPPVCVTYRNHNICGMGPPSSGALTVGQVMKLIEPFDLGQTPLNPSALHVIAEAQKLAFADRKRYMADSDFVDIPKGLLDDSYLSKRRQLIDPAKAMITASPGNPPLTKKSMFGKDHTTESNGTSHLSIIDQEGNAISMTTTIESAFGANIMVDGFLLNNELTDFSFLPKDKNGVLIANRVEPGKRPRSSMAPTMVFDNNGDLKMITGSPGGSRIILYVIKTLVAHLDWGLNAQQAADLANFGSRGSAFEVEPDALPSTTREKLQALGHKIRDVAMTSGSHLIIRNKQGLEGGADPRREGQSLGE